jgi:hypothetical protein
MSMLFDLLQICFICCLCLSVNHFDKRRLPVYSQLLRIRESFMSTTGENIHQRSVGVRKRHSLLSRIPVPSKKGLFAIGLSGAAVAAGGWEIHKLGQSSRDSEFSQEQANGDKRVDVALNLGRAGITNTLSLDPIKPDSCHITFSYEQIPNGTEPTLRMEQRDEGGNSFSRIAIHDGATAKQGMEDLCN